ncbi:hypothetical protein [Paenibacillus pinihumi]|uniref:hypothetical protein n=1 Tax=Paenibacillus pinihumi TaxID=669462 RepID=UPI0012B6730B|nr:hypothetical protein [Paenibacillus pinihumi]
MDILILPITIAALPIPLIPGKTASEDLSHGIPARNSFLQTYLVLQLPKVEKMRDF